MNIKIRLTLMSFLQFFVWGAWLITVGNYWFGTKQWSGAEFGAIFSTLGISSIIMPAITGIVADKWMNAERLYGILHILGGLCVAYLPQVDNPTTFYWVIFAAMMCYMPTISLSNSVAYTILKENDFDVVKVFPPIRVWGTVGFILAMWATNLTGNKASANMFYISALTALVLGVYSFTLPACKPQNLIDENATLSKKLGLDSFKLFGTYKMALFFVFSMFLGGALQLTNMYGDVFLSEFGNMPQYADSLIVKNSTLIMSISQISETLFILAIPFFLKRFGIKQVMLISMLAWVLRFGLFAYGNPASGLWMIILSCIVYGMAFDFFNISGSLFVETTTDSSIRSSAQGLFMMMTNGFGSFFGGLISGKVIDAYFTINGQRDWHNIWFSFAIYALIIAIAFAFLFKHKHNPKDVESFSH
ncbi:MULTISPECIES: nucleoside permease [Flavobacterium]|uniref:MFS transporter n=2 Tax=Flavobacterium TaxID=237 RepID=A0AA94JQM8_9FLAO|nr:MULTISPECIES: nucleoside permease [Flavobacterium]OXA83420.1 MFS transporter [Flavobacterium columnare] [Flavobacterium columnare NBRC 100251 = ATCC 23463]AMA49281.1 nucleoside permease [Flavobacterium covae]AND62982.1 nucleoside permease [Flavobacterium covae]MCH4828532.1 nucleoside permease [Flavobacterium columnare]MCJ1809295.1 nucleoside permease [Flavobacterium covae]